MIQWLIYFYFLANTFFAGYLFAKQDKFLNILLAFLSGLFMILYGIAWGIVSAIDNYFQIGFFWLFIFTNKFNNVDKETLKELNSFCKEKRNTKKINHRIYRYCISLVNKKNNYGDQTNRDNQDSE